MSLQCRALYDNTKKGILQGLNEKRAITDGSFGAGTS
jgi:hypothetical protein